jgi:hypothetical protein
MYVPPKRRQHWSHPQKANTQRTTNHSRTGKIIAETLKYEENLGDVSVEGKLIYLTLYEWYRARECKLDVSGSCGQSEETSVPSEGANLLIISS